MLTNRTASLSLSYVSNENLNKTTTMTSTKISPIIHASLAQTATCIAQAYLAALHNDTDNTMPTLENLVQNWKHEFAQNFYAFAKMRGANNAKFRIVEATAMARSEIRFRLSLGSSEATAAANKLIAIRAAQKAQAQAEISAEQFGFRAIPSA